MEQAPSRGHEASPQSELGVGCKLCSSSKKLRELRVHEETPKTENEREILMRRPCARTPSPRSFLLLGRSLQSTPSSLCGLASWPLLGACSMDTPESNF